MTDAVHYAPAEAPELLAALALAAGANPDPRRLTLIDRIMARATATIGSGAYDTVWEAGASASLYPWASLTSAVALELLSGSANDAAAGSGARTVRVTGLTGDYAEQSETVTLNGTSAVALTLSYLRVNAIDVLTCGSGGANAGALTLRLSGGGATVGYVVAGEMLSTHGVYTVPAGARVWLLTPDLCRTANTAVDTVLWARPAGGLFAPKLRYNVQTGTYTPGRRIPPAVLAAGSDIEYRGKAASTTSGMIINQPLLLETLP